MGDHLVSQHHLGLCLISIVDPLVTELLFRYLVMKLQRHQDEIVIVAMVEGESPSPGLVAFSETFHHGFLRRS
jgi:hypothetical protein